MQSLTVQNISIDFSSPEHLTLLAIGLILGLLLGALAAFFIVSSKAKKNREEGELRYQDLSQQSEQLKLQIHQLEIEQSSDRTQLRQLDALKSSLAEKQTENNQFQNDNVMLRTQMRAEQTRYEEQLAIVNQAKEQLTKEFENIANKIFDNEIKMINIVLFSWVFLFD